MAKNSGTDVKGFVSDWTGRGDEQKDSTTFWMDLFNRCFGITPAEVASGYARFEHQVKGMTPTGKVNTRRADVLIPDHRVLIEQKSIGVDLDKPRDNGVWGLETPFQQAKWYASNLPFSLRPRWVVICNFSTFRIYDLDQDVPELGYVEMALSELPRQVGLLSFMHSDATSKLVQERDLSVEAGNRVGRLYDALASCYHHIEDSAEEQRSLNILITRLVFLLYAEDADLLQTRTAFGDYCQGNPASLRERLVRLFETVDTPYEQRDEYLDPRVAEFPYIDGGLFEERHIIVPQLTGDVAAAIAEVSKEFDWSGISPTIFGAVFESTLNPETRRAGGMHYTSVENIHKVIGPLFLDGITADLERAEALVTVKARERALNRLHDKIAGLRFLDPACGSGNFLTETYLQLRRIENRILEAKAGDGQTMITTEGLIRVSLDQFYGIEINDFAVAVAKTALWISESQMLDETQSLFPLLDLDFLPLTSNEHIVRINALRMDWNDVLPAERCSYIIGNPPFVGYSRLDEDQKKDRLDVCGKGSGFLDYVACWYFKAADYIANYPIRCALVSTNSICQGLQVDLLWRPLFDSGVGIDFCWRAFVWDSEATEQAHVHCVIVGFSRLGGAKTIYDSNGLAHEASNINGYLLDAPSQFISKRSKPLCEVPPMAQGHKPAEHGCLLLSARERDELVAAEPEAERWIRPFSMGAEFINGVDRYCLWLHGITEDELEALPLVKQHVDACRAWREAQVKTGDAYRYRTTPHLFKVCNYYHDVPYIGIPKVSSERRRYIPMGFVANGMIPGDKLYFVESSSLFVFGIMQSLFHNAWMRVVSGRLEMRYSYANTIVYNNFVWPKATAEQRERVETCAQSVLDARAEHPGSSLADLYDPDEMPDDLRSAHDALDEAVEAAYGVDFGGDEERIVAHLFRLYDEATRNQ